MTPQALTLAGFVIGVVAMVQGARASHAALRALGFLVGAAFIGYGGFLLAGFLWWDWSGGPTGL